MIEFCNYKKFKYFNSYKLYCATKRKKITEDTRTKYVLSTLYRFTGIYNISQMH